MSRDRCAHVPWHNFLLHAAASSESRYGLVSFRSLHFPAQLVILYPSWFIPHIFYKKFNPYTTSPFKITNFTTFLNSNFFSSRQAPFFVLNESTNVLS